MRFESYRWDSGAAQFIGERDVRDAQFVLFFGSNPTITDPRFLAGIKARCPNAHILGCTTGTLIDGPELEDEAALFIAVKLDQTRVKIASAAVSVESSRVAGRTLAEQLNAPDLAGVLVLCDSLNVDGSELVAGLREKLPDGVKISGGLASDGSAFQRTLVSADSIPMERMSGAIGFYGSKFLMSQGCAHGWDEFGPSRKITRAEGNVLYELDGQPALDLYEKYLGDEAAELPGSALRFPLLVSEPGESGKEIIRTVLDVDREARTLTFASAVQTGWNARLMRGALDHLAQGAANAAAEIATVQDDSEGLAILISCVGRRIVFGQWAEDETDAVASILAPKLRQFGFYSHGEISSANSDAFLGLHNQTMTIVSMQEVA